MNWQSPSEKALSRFSSTCWLFGRELHKKRKIPVGLVGIYVNQTDLWPWTPLETIERCKAYTTDHVDGRGHWNAMLFPFFNLSATGGIFYEGQVDVEKGDALDHHECMLNGTLTEWLTAQRLSKIVVVGLGNNNNATFSKNTSWPELRWIQSNLTSHVANTILVPSHDLQDSEHRLSRHKLDLASRIVNVTTSAFDQTPKPPSISKACYVYIYINLDMSEQVTETPGYQSHGFQSCCRDQAHLNDTCFHTGPNGSIEELTSTKDGNGYLFSQGCKFGNSSGIVTEIYYGWNKGYPYLKSPLYGAFTKLPAATSFTKVVNDPHDPECVH